jgi:hypothetical protein
MAQVFPKAIQNEIFLNPGAFVGTYMVYAVDCPFWVLAVLERFSGPQSAVTFQSRFFRLTLPKYLVQPVEDDLM